MKIIMVSVDSLRASHMGSYGYTKPTTPHLDQIASEGIVFENAYASDIPTEAVHTAVFSGKLGINTGIVSHGSKLTQLSSDELWLPTMLRKLGMITGAVDNLYQLKEWFARGFQYYINSSSPAQRWIDGETVNGLTFPWLREHKDDDFFLFLHYWDPHTPYLPPSDYIHLFYDENKDPYDPSNKSMTNVYNHTAYPFFKHHHFDLIGPVTDAEYVNALYDSEIRYLDDKIKALDCYLEELGIKDETMLIIFGDHGESLTEHDIYWDHCGLYENTVRVPLMIRWPQKIEAGKRIKGFVQQADLMPTVLETVDPGSLSSERNQDLLLDGQSLWPIIENLEKETISRVYLSECAWQAARGIRTERYKFIRNYDSGPFLRPPLELYDLAADPEELTNLALVLPELTHEFEKELNQWVEKQLGGKEDPMQKQLREEGLPFRKRIEKILYLSDMNWEDWKANPSWKRLIFTPPG